MSEKIMTVNGCLCFEVHIKASTHDKSNPHGSVGVDKGFLKGCLCKRNTHV